MKLIGVVELMGYNDEEELKAMLKLGKKELKEVEKSIAEWMPIKMDAEKTIANIEMTIRNEGTIDKYSQEIYKIAIDRRNMMNEMLKEKYRRRASLKNSLKTIDLMIKMKKLEEEADDIQYTENVEKEIRSLRWNI